MAAFNNVKNICYLSTSLSILLKAFSLIGPTQIVKQKLYHQRTNYMQFDLFDKNNLDQ